MKSESPLPDTASSPDRAEDAEHRDGAPTFPLSKLLTGPTPDSQDDKSGKVPSKR